MAVPTVAAASIVKEASYNASDWNISLAGIATISSGDLLVAICGMGVGGERNFSDPSGWTKLDRLYNGSDQEMYVWARVATGSDSLTLAKGGLNTGGVCALYRVTGWYGTIAGGVEADVANSGSNDPPNLAPSWGTSEEHLWLAATIAADTATVTSYPSNYTANQLTDVTSGQTPRFASAARTNSAASSSENPGAFTMSVASGLVATVGVRPTGGGGSTAKPGYYYAQL